jgi:hypothetical protein
MSDFDDVTFQEQFLFTKSEIMVILSNMQDQNGADLADEATLPAMMNRIGSGKRDYIRCRSDIVDTDGSVETSFQMVCVVWSADSTGPLKVRPLQGFQIHGHQGQQAIWQAGVERENLERVCPSILKALARHGTLKETCRPGDLFCLAFRFCLPSVCEDFWLLFFSFLCLLAPCGTGNGCVFVNMKDHQVFQGKDRKHGYSYLLGAVGW